MNLASRLASIAAVAVLVTGCTDDGARQPAPLSSAPAPAARSEASVADLFDNPVAYPGVTWTHEGQPVPADVIVAAAGPEHCGSEKATFLTIGWPLGTSAPTAINARQFVRDPSGVVPTTSFRSSLDTHARLPPDARPTGYRTRGIELYFAASDEDSAVYVVGSGSTERWPRSEPMTLCS